MVYYWCFYGSCDPETDKYEALSTVIWHPLYQIVVLSLLCFLIYQPTPISTTLIATFFIVTVEKINY